MYKIYADGVLIYDSTLDDYKIGKGQITLETGKSGSFVFSLYPDHFAYDAIVRMRTVVTVYKFNRIVFRGRVLNDVTDYWNNKTYTCEGELGFLQDSIVRPYSFTGTPAALFERLITQHNEQLDTFKRFQVGTVNVPGASTVRANSSYESTQANMTSLRDDFGGHFVVTHEDGGQETAPTLHWVTDYDKTATQSIEFGVNLKNYTKTVKAEDMATVIIPLGATVDDGNSETEDPKLTIASVNGGMDHIYHKEGMSLYGQIVKVVEWPDVTDAAALKAKAEEYLDTVVNQAITIELTAIDLRLLDRSVESFGVGEYINVVSAPHGFRATLLCNKQTLDLLQPANDTMTLGHTYATLTERNTKVLTSVARLAATNKLTDTLLALAGATGQNSEAIAEIIARLDAMEGGGTGEEPGDETDDPTIV